MSIERRKKLLLLGGTFPTFKFNYSLATFTAAMAKRVTSPFATSPIVQGLKDGTGTPDVISVSRGAAVIAGTGFYPNFDTTQGNLTFFWTPEYSSSGIATNYHYFMYASSTFFFAYDYTNAWYYMKVGNQALTVASAVAAGTKYTLSFAWNCNNTLDGTNYGRVSINDAHTFGITTKPTLAAPDATMYIGSSGTQFACSGLLQGMALYRRPLWDGTYGVNCGNGDELALIHAAGVGADAATILGSWDEVLFIPTNSTAGALATGTGEAHTHPHSSNLLTDGWLQSYYGNQWGVKFVGTGYINCGSGATLDDLCAGGAIMQVEGWYKASYTGAVQAIVSKGARNTTGWMIIVTSSWSANFEVMLAGGKITATCVVTPPDSKWHHFVAHYNDTTKVAQMAQDGVWGAASAAGAGAYVSDAALNFCIGGGHGLAAPLTGEMGWINIYNNAFYTPGTNFKPPRVPTAPDVEEWLLNEGTGVTAAAQVTSPANDGTITNGTWQPQWYAEGTPIVPTSVQGSTSYVATITAAATINDLADNAFTVDGWFRIPKTGAIQVLFQKGLSSTNGWYFGFRATGSLYAIVYCAVSNATSETSARYDDGRWHYMKATWDDAGDRKPYITVDNVAVAQTQVAGNGAIISDAANNGYISRAISGMTGGHGWMRWSNVVRGAGMISRYAGPAVDGNTVVQFEATEGAGAVLTDSSGNANHGAMAGTYSWINTGAMDLDSPGARVYGWGDAVGSDAVNEGKKQTLTGLTAGANYVIRASAYSEDGVGIPRVEVYDETNAATITALTGLATSTEWTPDVLLFSFELPTNARGAAADCTSISIKRISTTAGNVAFHQLELYSNLLDNPSLDTGAVADPFVPYGWTSYDLDAGDSEAEAVVRHSEGASVEFNNTVAAEGLSQVITAAANSFFAMGGYCYGDGTDGMIISPSGAHALFHYSAADRALAMNVTAAWVRSWAVWRSLTATPTIFFYGGAAGGDRLLDDLFAIALDAVTLTVTPASAANSLESPGLRVDGLDKAPQTISGISLSKGKIKFNITPRHSAATVALLGNATPIVAYILGDANNYITLDWSAANTLRLRYNASGGGVQTGTWDATGAIVAGTTYAIEIKYTGAAMTVSVDNTLRITITAACIFNTALGTFYPGSDATPANQFDAVYS